MNNEQALFLNGLRPIKQDYSYSTTRNFVKFCLILFFKKSNEQSSILKINFFSTTRNFVHKNKNQPVYFVLYIMAKKDKKVNAWQIIAAVFQALAALFGSLKKSHDSAKAESDSEGTSQDPEGDE